MSQSNIIFNAEDWIEHRNHEGLTMSITVVLKGMIDSDVKITREFDWVIPDELKTKATWFGINTKDSPENNEINNNNYQAVASKWIEHIMAADDYVMHCKDMITYLESLQEPVYHEKQPLVDTSGNDVPARENS